MAPVYDEVLLGGGNYGGKSYALLLWLIQWADVPGYNAMAFRRESPELWKPGGLIPTSQKILGPAQAKGWCRFNETKRQWTFDSGATLTFSSLQYDSDADDLDGLELQRIGFDELTKFTAYQWTRAQTRLRALDGFPIDPSAAATSNPDGPGREWVSHRFGCDPRLKGLPECVYVHSVYTDNKRANHTAYRRKLMKLDPVLRAQKLRGDWTIEAKGPLWSAGDFPTYDSHPKDLVRRALEDDPRAKVFSSWDCKNKLKTRPRDGESFVSGTVWLFTRGKLYLLDEEHGPWGFNDTVLAFYRLVGRWPEAKGHHIENKALGPELIRQVKAGGTLRLDDGRNVELKPVAGVIKHEPGKGSKEDRIAGCQTYVLAGDVWTPSALLCPWVSEWRAELGRAPKAPNDRADSFEIAVSQTLAPTAAATVAVARSRSAMSRFLKGRS